MRKQMSAGRGALLSRVALVGLVGGLVAACDNTSRFSENPFSNPFNNSAGASQQVASAPVQPVYQPAPQQMATYAPTPSYSSQPLQPVANVAGGGWTTSGGTAIVVGQGDNLTSISNRYGVPANAILSANGLTASSQVAAGKNIVIPVYSSNLAGTKVAAASTAVPTPVPVPVRSQSGNLAATSLNNQAKAVATNATGKAKQVVNTKVAAAEKQVAQPVATAKTQVQTASNTAQSAVAEPVRTASAATANAQKDAEQTASIATAAKPSSDFRWPAKGRVISGFGSGGGNEGINIAVPEGTPVRATEAGTVTFAGDDVKSYGNLVLIKHDNGYISAYAHNGSLNVKRGERVSRGQVIAKSGQTGDVTSPQLHFEIRKGQTPVDPVPYLGS
ncbi:peptidoglycan DD-metalloendopeptidase family protein [Microvirga sp. W0021]|uniref:Peptidoglycan DD-metalloendopeptidase family protein n=1 Tax=Hohaiivirga grylli TaxID=3133970 RepID=A0ABV0BKU1_9HYPH